MKLNDQARENAGRLKSIALTLAALQAQLVDVSQQMTSDELNGALMDPTRLVVAAARSLGEMRNSIEDAAFFEVFGPHMLEDMIAARR